MRFGTRNKYQQHTAVTQYINRSIKINKEKQKFAPIFDFFMFHICSRLYYIDSDTLFVRFFFKFSQQFSQWFSIILFFLYSKLKERNLKSETKCVFLCFICLNPPNVYNLKTSYYYFDVFCFCILFFFVLRF
jgi:hypothetical protein